MEIEKEEYKKIEEKDVGKVVVTEITGVGVVGWRLGG